MSDPELQDLERLLDETFSLSKPRRGFEDELWARLAARRPWWRRVVSVNPWPLAGGAVAVAVAGLLVVAGRGGSGHPGFPGSDASAPGVAAQPASGPNLWEGRPGADGAFGPLPRLGPAGPGPASAGTGPPGAAGSPAPAIAEAGAARVTAALPAVPPALPVVGYTVAPGAEAGFQRALEPGFSGRVLEAPESGREPLFSVSATGLGGGPAGGPEGDPRERADAYRRRLGWLPLGPERVVVAPAGPDVAVRFVRLFEVAGLAEPVPQADQAGRPAGVEVTLGASGGLGQASSPLPARLATAPYRSRPPAEAAADAASAARSPGRPVDLDRVQLVYVAVADGRRRGFFEPAYLFTSSGSGVSVLVSALELSQLR